jgi:lipopolysaccharide/colanic/teichoic acid biosynthesis glycosyltransferase
MEDHDRPIAEASWGQGTLFEPRSYFSSLYLSWGKRVFDLAGSLAGLLLLSPLLLLSALLVRVTSRGPVLFRQRRIGRWGRPFNVIKFRTMRQGAERSGPAVVVRGDKRLTLLGGFLRRTKLDELPQLFNVLMGDMSLVGPRPRVREEIDVVPHEERLLLTLRPGLTSYASLYHHTEADYCAQYEDPQAAHRENILPQKAHLDKDYLENVGFALDVKLILLTILLVFVPGKARPKVVSYFGYEFPSYNRAAQVALEAGTYMAALWLAFWLRYDQGLPPGYRFQRELFLILLPLCRLATNQVFGVYRMIWRYVNLIDAARVALSITVVSTVFLGLRLLLPSENDLASLFQLPITVIAMEYLLSMGGCLGLRVSRRLLYQLGQHYQPLRTSVKRRLLLVGAGLSSLGVALEIARHPHLKLVGYVDDDEAKHGGLIAGCTVLGSYSSVAELIGRKRVTDVIIADPSLSEEKLRAIVRKCQDAGASVHLVPTIEQILGAQGPMSRTTAGSERTRD